MAVTSAFYYATLEEYYTGGLFLKVCNGVSDGSFAYMCLFLVAGIFGNDIFL